MHMPRPRRSRRRSVTPSAPRSRESTSSPSSRALPSWCVRLVPPEAPGLTLKRNGAAMLKTDLDRPIPVDPQDYGFEASAPGFATWKGAVVVRGDGAVVTIMVPPLEREATHAAGGGRRDVRHTADRCGRARRAQRLRARRWSRGRRSRRSLATTTRAIIATRRAATRRARRSRAGPPRREMSRPRSSGSAS